MRAVGLRGRPDCAVVQSAFSETGQGQPTVGQRQSAHVSEAFSSVIFVLIYFLVLVLVLVFIIFSF